VACVGFLPLSILIFFVLELLKRREIPEISKQINRGNILKRLYIDFPKQLAEDFFSREPDTLPMYGLHLIVGEQGSGKTVCLTEMLLGLKKQYPKIKISTNYNYKYQDSEINHWKDIVFDNNGIFGKVEVLDEIQNWFSSLQSKDFPPEMITEISQQRKQRKMIIGTSQVFSRVAKPIREQVTVLYRPITVGGCLTIVRVSRPMVDSDGKIIKNRGSKIYFFIHSAELRNAFDTYKKIEKMSKEGFKNDISQNLHS
jgi:archaellum biogenesis ATPase FlaH